MTLTPEDLRPPPAPVVLVSKCLGFDACRWNGDILHDDFVQKLEPFVEYRPVCPECEIGLGVPRHPIRLVQPGNQGPVRLFQPATEREVTTEMNDFASGFCDRLDDFDGILLKSRSPSCGPNDVPVYHDTGKGSRVGKASGSFAAVIAERFPTVPTEDEGRLKNFTIREHYLIRLFALAELRGLESRGQMRELVSFHSRMKYLLMAFNQTALRELGRIVANHGKLPVAEVFPTYRHRLQEALATAPPYTNRINALQHAYGHVSKKLDPAERQYFLDILEEYRRGGLPMSVPVSLIKAWALRFEDNYLLAQKLLCPYPDALVEITDSGKGRNR